MNIVRENQEHDHIPDYSLDYDEEEDIVTFTNRQTVKAVLPPCNGAPTRPRCL